MSGTKDELLKHLNMSSETYSEMAKLTDHYYNWLTSEKKHLKENCKRKPPYDWSDIVEKAKDKAMEKIARSGDAHIRFYWDLAVPTADCPNWIARWFLYHKFRYRDGRNRNPSSKAEGSSRTSRRYHTAGTEDRDGRYDYAYYALAATTYGQNEPAYAYTATASPNTLHVYPYETVPQYGSSTQPYTQSQGASGTYYDPVRDTSM